MLAVSAPLVFDLVSLSAIGISVSFFDEGSFVRRHILVTLTLIFRFSVSWRPVSLLIPFSGEWYLVDAVFWAHWAH